MVPEPQPSTQPPAATPTNTPVPTPSPSTAKRAPSTISAGKETAEMGMPRPAQPVRPPADKTVSLHYEEKNGVSVSVVGVCKITEDAISCWDMNRKRNVDLEKNVLSSIEKQQNNTSIQFKFGKKNRLIAVRSTNATDGQESAMIMPDPDSNFSGFTMMGLSRPDNDFRTILMPIMKTVDMDKKTATVRVLVHESAKNSVDLPLKPGAEATLDNATVKVVRIYKGLPKTMPFYDGEQSAKWTADVTITRGKGRLIQLNVYAGNGHSGWTMVDRSGNPVDQETFRKYQDEQMRKSSEPGLHRYNPADTRYFMVRAMLTPEERNDKTQHIVMNANPEKINSVRITGRYMRTVDINDIPVDPQ